MANSETLRSGSLAEHCLAAASVIAMSGFHYSAVEKNMSFTSRMGNYFWSNGYVWGTCIVEGKKVTLNILSGRIELSKFTLEGLGSVELKNVVLNCDTNKSLTMEFK